MYEARWLKAGAFLPLDDVLASNSIDLARYAQGPLGGCQLDGQQFCLGSYLGLVVLLYDRQAFDAASLPHPSATVPMSVDEYAQVATKLAKPDPDLAKRVWGGEVAPTFWWMDTLNLYSEDGRSVVGLVDDEATIHAWDVLGKMARDGVGITGAEQEAAGLELTDLLATHQLAMAIGDNTAVGELQDQGVDVGVAPLPVERAGDPVWASTWMDMWAVPAKASHPDAAKELVVWIATEGNKIRAEAGAPPLDLQLAKDLAGLRERPSDRSSSTWPLRRSNGPSCPASSRCWARSSRMPSRASSRTGTRAALFEPRLRSCRRTSTGNGRRGTRSSSTAPATLPTVLG